MLSTSLTAAAAAAGGGVTLVHDSCVMRNPLLLGKIEMQASG
jgi:hypothetical protein